MVSHFLVGDFACLSFRAKRRRVVERSEKSREHKVDVHEILPPFGRLNDKDGGKFVILKGMTIGK